ncbi:PoNe immunity protein domain-containing protein [Bacillus pacificus]
MLRDTLKDKEYFLEYISEEEDRINKFETKLRNNEVREDRILNVRKKVYDLEYQILIAKYSMGGTNRILDRRL